MYSGLVEKQCRGCASVLPANLEHFNKSSASKDGLFSHCKLCACKQSREWYASHKSQAADRAKRQRAKPGVKEQYSAARKVYELKNKQKLVSQRKAYNVQYRRTVAGYIRRLVCEANSRARKCGLPYGVRPADVLRLWESQSGTCAITGVPIVVPAGGKGRSVDNGISLDRISPKLGYVSGNVQLVSCLANRMKTDLEMPEFLDLCERIVHHRSQVLRANTLDDVLPNAVCVSPVNVS